MRKMIKQGCKGNKFYYFSDMNFKNNRIIFFFLAITLNIHLSSFAQSSQKKVEIDKCLDKVYQQWAKPCCTECPGSEDAYTATYKNTCKYTIDAAIGVQEKDKSWKWYYYPGIKPNDTIRVYTCNVAGK